MSSLKLASSRYPASSGTLNLPTQAVVLGNCPMSRDPINFSCEFPCFLPGDQIFKSLNLFTHQSVFLPQSFYLSREFRLGLDDLTKLAVVRTEIPVIDGNTHQPLVSPSSMSRGFVLVRRRSSGRSKSISSRLNVSSSLVFNASLAAIYAFDDESGAYS